jgi:hypothetical protein
MKSKTKVKSKTSKVKKTNSLYFVEKGNNIVEVMSGPLQYWLHKLELINLWKIWQEYFQMIQNFAKGELLITILKSTLEQFVQVLRNLWVSLQLVTRN